MDDRHGTTGTASGRRTPAPWHLWPVAVFFLLLYAGGSYDYVMALSVDEAYLREQGNGPEKIAYFTDYPLVPAVFWTVGIVAGQIAPILLLFRLRWAAPLALVSALAQACLSLITFGFMGRLDVYGPWLSLFDLSIVVLTFGLYLYCRRMRTRGVLR